MIATLGIERRGQRAKELVCVLNKHPDVVSTWESVGGALRQTDSAFSKGIEDLDRIGATPRRKMSNHAGLTGKAGGSPTGR